MSILSALIDRWNDAQAESMIGTAAHAADIVAGRATQYASNQLLPHQVDALNVTAAALIAQQRDFGYVDIDPAQAEAIVSAANVINGWDYSNEDVGQ